MPALREHLRELLESPAFKGSRRSQQFVQHIVEKAQAGQKDELKERSLGVALFGRTPPYDTGDDAIVRVTASDVRKRLHQFYSETDSAIRIELLSVRTLTEHGPSRDGRDHKNGSRGPDRRSRQTSHSHAQKSRSAASLGDAGHRSGVIARGSPNGVRLRI
jgi:hypothetical protein